MKFIILSFLFPSLAFAIEGTFYFANEVKVSNINRVELVYPQSPMGQERLQELLDQGYDCPMALQFRRCAKNVNETQFADSIAHFKPKFDQITFSSIKSKNTLYQGEGYVEYKADQEITTPTQKYSPAVYIEMTNLEKMTAGDVNAGNYLAFVVEKDQIFHTLDVSVKESQWVFRVYSLEVKYSAKKN